MTVIKNYSEINIQNMYFAPNSSNGGVYTTSSTWKWFKVRQIK